MPYLLRFFNACIRLSYHPARFRISTLVPVKKAGRRIFNKPTDWRPIELLSPLGKMLEKIFNERMIAIVATNHLLPETQFAGPGKQATGAIEYLMGILHRAWSPQRHNTAYKLSHHPRLTRVVSYLGLDLAGAFNSVPQLRLLKVLISVGMPDWIVEYVRSFLSARVTRVRIPGSHLSEPYHVNIGIPQGSPMSSILFMLYAAKLLEMLRDTDVLVGHGAEHYAFAYSDDHGIVVVGSSYEENCEAIQKLHTVVVSARHLIHTATGYCKAG